MEISQNLSDGGNCLCENGGCPSTARYVCTEHKKALCDSHKNMCLFDCRIEGVQTSAALIQDLLAAKKFFEYLKNTIEQYGMGDGNSVISQALEEADNRYHQVNTDVLQAVKSQDFKMYPELSLQIKDCMKLMESNEVFQKIALYKMKRAALEGEVPSKPVSTATKGGPTEEAALHAPPTEADTDIPEEFKEEYDSLIADQQEYDEANIKPILKVMSKYRSGTIKFSKDTHLEIDLYSSEEQNMMSDLGSQELRLPSIRKLTVNWSNYASPQTLNTFLLNCTPVELQSLTINYLVDGYVRVTNFLPGLLHACSKVKNEVYLNRLNGSASEFSSIIKASKNAERIVITLALIQTSEGFDFAIDGAYKTKELFIQGPWNSMGVYWDKDPTNFANFAKALSQSGLKDSLDRIDVYYYTCPSVERARKILETYGMKQIVTDMKKLATPSD